MEDGAAETFSAVRLTLVAALTTALGVLPAFLLGGLSIFIAPELGFGPSQLGFAVSLFFAVSALFAAPAGRFGDRVAPAVGVRVGTAISVVTLLGIGLLARSYTVLLLLLVIGGIGNSATQMAGNVMLVTATPIRHQAKAFAVKQSSVPFANLLGGAAVPVLGLTLGWRWAYVLAVLLGLVVLGRLPATRPSTGRDDGAALRRFPLVILAAGAATAAGAGNAVAIFLVPAVTDAGVQPALAGALLAIGGTAGIVGRLLGGWLRDRVDFDGINAAAGLVGLGSLGLILLSLGVEGVALVGATILTFGGGWGWAALFTHTVARAHPRASGRATGITQTGIFAGGVLGPSTIGLVIDNFGYRSGWLAAVALTVLGLMLLLAGNASLKAGTSGP
jgi:MFS family permease